MRGPYFIARDLYWRMPEGLRNSLRGPARHIAQTLRDTTRDGGAGALLRASSGSTDLTWQQFRDNILSHVDAFKGVFVQSVVIDWNVDLYQRPQHMATAFARLGYLVIYQTDNWAKDDVVGFRQVRPNVWITNHKVLDFISDAVVSIYSTAYAYPDAIADASKKKVRIVYEYIDHIAPEISGEHGNIEILNEIKNRAFSGGTDFIVASAGVLYEEAVAAVGKDKVVLVPNGVDTRHYRNHASDDVALSDAFMAFRRKYKNVVGYFGALAPWIWYEEVNRLTESRPDLGFIFIGPDYFGGLEKIRQAENVLCTGPIDYQDLPAYAKNFDICLIPFEPGEIARTTSPLKLFEYFALEKPVVVTSVMNECVSFPEVFAGADADELSGQIDKALAVKDDPAFKARLAELADENDWDHRAGAYEKVFEGLRT